MLWPWVSDMLFLWVILRMVTVTVGGLSVDMPVEEPYDVQIEFMGRIAEALEEVCACVFRFCTMYYTCASLGEEE